MKFKWLDISECTPPHRITHESHLEILINSLKNGWDLNCPVLIGYELDGLVQLISGSHRYEACRYNKLKLPVIIYEYNYIESIFGSNLWIDLVSNPPLLKEFYEQRTIN